MQISTNPALASSLTSFLSTQFAQLMSSSATSTDTFGFGPASLLNLGQSTASIGGDYSFLASLGAQLRSPGTQQLSPQQQKAESETVKQANVLRLNYEFDGARELLTDLLKKNPSSALATHALGAIELDLRNYAQAEHLFRKADHLAPEYGFGADAENARILRGDDNHVLTNAERMLRSNDQRDAAQRLLVVLTQRSPSNARARMMLAENLVRDGDATTGLAQYQMAIAAGNRTELLQIESRLHALAEIAPQSAFVRNLLGQTELRLGKSEQASETLALASRLSEYDPAYLEDEARAYLLLGREALEVGDFTSAINHYETAEELAGSNDSVQTAMAEALATRAEWRARVGDPSRAIGDFLDAKAELASIDNEDLRSRIALGLYRAGRTLAGRRDQAGADVGDELRAFEAAYQLDPENATYRNTLAATYALQADQYLAEGDYQNAAAAYASAYETDDDTSAYRDSAVAAYVAWGDDRSSARDHSQAILAYGLAYDLDPDDDSVKLKLADAYNTRGLFYRQLGGDYYGDAADDFLAALDLFPNNGDYQSNYDSVS